MEFAISCCRAEKSFQERPTNKHQMHIIYNKKLELMLTRRAKAYSSSGSVV